MFKYRLVSIDGSRKTDFFVSINDLEKSVLEKKLCTFVTGYVVLWKYILILKRRIRIIVESGAIFNRGRYSCSPNI